MSKQAKYIISGGGTGGHIFPAIAIANMLKELQPHCEILFVGAEGKMEMQKVPEAGYKILGLPIAGFQRGSILKNLTLPFKIISSLLKARKIISEFKPNAVVGVGGYASGPLLQAAAQKKLPYLIQEQNSFAGKTNKLLAPNAAKICVAFKGMEQFFPKEKIIITGNPIRKEVVDIQNKRFEGAEMLKLDPKKKTILVTGGSLGAKTLNESISTHLQKIINADIQLIWQTGNYYYDGIIATLGENFHPNVRILKFLNRMDLAYACADIIISRAGAGTIAELCMIGKPVVLVPSPNVAEDHQTKNALALTQENAAILVTDAEARENLINITLQTLNQHELCATLSKNIQTLALPNAALHIAQEVINMSK